MKILFYEPLICDYGHVGILLDEIIRLEKEGHSIIYAYNGCSNAICSDNMASDSVQCALCKKHMRNIINLLPKTVQKIDLQSLMHKREADKFEYNNVFELKKIEYKGVKIGYSVMSSYICRTRNLYPKIDETSKPYFDKLLYSACNITDALEIVVQNEKPDRICSFNARLIEQRPPYDIAQKYGIDFYAYEVYGGRNEQYYKTYFHNSTPHNIKTRYEKYITRWDSADWSDEKKKELAESFYYKRRNAIPAGDKVYVANQEVGKLPSNWDAKKHNIVIFNSSEDEFASVGDEYDSYALFPSQYDGIKYIIEHTKDIPGIHIYLRVHPNLTKVKYQYHLLLNDLAEGYSHVTIVKATDTISSYAMMDAANTVVVFGSTMGAESAYWGKPVVLLAGADYYCSNICYKPQNKEELLKLLAADLKAKNNEDALKMAFHIMYRDPKDKYQYVDFNFATFNIGKLHFRVVKYLKLFESYKLYALYYHIIKHFIKKNRTTIMVPEAEDESIYNK